MRCSYIASDAMWLYVACVYVCTRWTLSFSLALLFFAFHNGIGVPLSRCEAIDFFPVHFSLTCLLQFFSFFDFIRFCFPSPTSVQLFFHCVFVHYVCLYHFANERKTTNACEHKHPKIALEHTHAHTNISTQIFTCQKPEDEILEKTSSRKEGKERERVRAKEAALPSHFFRAVFFGAFSFIFHHVAEDGMYSIQFMILKTYTHISSV